MSADIIDTALNEHQAVITRLQAFTPVIRQIADRIRLCLNQGGKLLLMGNGGSAADSQHIAAEFVGRFRRERRGLPAIALTTDTSILTSIGNDYGYEHIFARQIDALCEAKDVVVGITTSGNSPSVIKAIQLAREMGACTIGFSGESGGRLAEVSELTLKVPSANTARIQEGHILVGHILCELLDDLQRR
ncbi:D-sedoheptulose 7-phosphate isomerase [Candidatus Methylospira mobilis]|uniref:Phosphoheptose isomerase n=1 Tax=Candidatus Methylospira mobilis TaxID=1808979 RepID=A0A5Q0BI58_9GAMM|nr:D-sedoheptulose 7-phosphate isomerase [Candidatus Methylospira mobilis]QFY41818.1 D-sedoheptulose 7-phosphate isomerase [Candidatus Methylospira mobilis]WNV06685.1 D-sedoheptulose 7-phosphate isomerase [Candidatus Methylospira mobilis]